MVDIPPDTSHACRAQSDEQLICARACAAGSQKEDSLQRNVCRAECADECQAQYLGASEIYPPTTEHYCRLPAKWSGQRPSKTVPHAEVCERRAEPKDHVGMVYR